ncbi:MAG: hypothetical protein RLN75_02130, partial [Longimicrobiales bacterium]
MRPIPTLLAVAAVAASGVILARAAPRFPTGAEVVRAPSAHVPSGFFAPPTGLQVPDALQDPRPEVREFFFTRAAYSGYGGQRRNRPHEEAPVKVQRTPRTTRPQAPGSGT